MSSKYEVMSNTSLDSAMYLLCGFLVSLMLVGGIAWSDVTDKLVLFSEETAAKLRYTNVEWVALPPISYRSISPGPKIRFIEPGVDGEALDQRIELISPATFWIEFDSNLAPVDMSSLAVVARKGILKKSLNGVFSPFIDGTTLKADLVEIPSGKFVIDVSISDERGATTKESYRLVVKSG